MKPRPEFCVNPRQSETFVGFHEDLLADIFCVMPVSCHIKGNPEHSRFEPIYNLPKGVKITLFRPINEGLII